MYGILKCRELKYDQNKALSLCQYFEGAQKVGFKTRKFRAFIADMQNFKNTNF